MEAEREADGDGDGGGEIACERPVEAHVHEGVAVGDAITDLDDGSGGAAEGRCGQYPGERSANLVVCAGEVVAELVDEQDAEERGRESPACDEHIGMVGEPSPGPKVAVANDGWQAFKEVLHKPGAVSGCGDNADAEQEQGQAVLAEA